MSRGTRRRRWRRRSGASHRPERRPRRSPRARGVQGHATPPAPTCATKPACHHLQSGSSAAKGHRPPAAPPAARPEARHPQRPGA
eukprot:scaffold9106_cov118-Isochrysis_galbana.AAC.11